jgi:hypothetical protein
MSDQVKSDFRDVLTVFVSTVGSPTFETCLRHLEEQDCEFSLGVIDHVAPMSAALQKMMDDCETPFYVQVDEDMLLYPHAVRTLYRRFADMASDVAQYVCALYDVHLDRVIYGLKIYRHDVVRHYPYRDVTGSEWDQIRRFRADGYKDIRAPLEGETRDSENTLGLHGTCWDPETIYLRFRVLEIKRREGNATHAWVADAAEQLLKRFLAGGSELDFYALMGILGGSVPEGAGAGTEKDYRTYGQTPGLLPLHHFLREVNTSRKPPGE